MLTLILIRSCLQDGAGNKYSVFSGFMPASRLVSLCSVPAFSSDTTHAKIGTNVNSNPVEDWQRPENSEKIEHIADRFSRHGEIMPNPVLLASAVSLSPRVIHTADDGTQMCEVTLDPAAQKLLVLDGQHRIKGIAASRRPDNAIPFVLLADVGAPAYNPSMFARIFAEVTTQSSRLDSLHDSWLKYAFKLDEYEPAGSPPNPTSSYLAMQAATTLVSWLPDPPTTNPFYDHVALNPSRQVSPPVGHGFSYTAVSMATLIKDGYFDNPHRSSDALLSANELAKAIAAAVTTLSTICTTAVDKSVFFGEQDYRQQPMQDAFLLALLGRLATKGVPGSWDTLLRNLKFNTSNWNFKSWVVRLDGNTGGRSRELARKCMTEALAQGALDPRIADIPTHLRGDGATITLVFARVNDAGRVVRNSGEEVTYSVARRGTHTLEHTGSHRLLLKEATTNIGKLVAWNTNSPRDEYTKSTLSSTGMPLTQDGNDSCEIEMEAEYYGGVTERFRLAINWP